jgi:UDPglucose 6-dehydrogenase
MFVAVIGTGYVGLVTGAVFADLGNDVICADADTEKIEMLLRGEMPIYEPGLEEMVKRNMADNRLRFTTDVQEAARRSQVVFIAVGTPPKENGEPDLTAVEQVAFEIAGALDSYKVIVNKSTVPVGTGDFVRDILEKNRHREVDFDVVSNPEFLREGSAIKDTLHPDRIIIGAPSQQVAMTLLELYAPLERPMLITDIHSAEVIKYASNSFLAMKISFMNMIADLCEECGADVIHVMRGMGYDSRIGNQFLQPGLGYGGSCFPKDTDALIHTGDRYGFDFKMLRHASEINRERPQRFLQRILEVMGSVKGKTAGLLGLAFKPDTDDLREARSIELIRLLLEKGASIRAYDPIAMSNCRQIFPDITYCYSSYEAAEGADLLCIVTEWNEFKLLNLERIRESMKSPVIFDGRNIYDPLRMKKMGFTYYGIGRPLADGRNGHGQTRRGNG